jgi:heme iron utilization protein
MSRPSQHGGGQSGPPIAGDPSTFPPDAELARTLAANQTRATLSTLTAEGYPYGSAVSYAVDDSGAPILLVSEMAEHTVNVRGDDRVSLLVAADIPEGADPLSTARMTLVGRMHLLDEPGERRDAYLEAHPYAAYYADFTDFGFWRLGVEQCRFVGGFGHMSWVDGDAYAAAPVDPVSTAADGIIAHMNEDHAEANLLYATVLAGLPDATDSRMVGIDRHGITLRVETPDAPRMARLGFPEPLASADDARPAVIELLARARAQSG